MGRSIYTIEDINSELDFAPNAFVALDYSGAPTVSQLEQEITADLHTNQFQEIGCHICGNVDMFTRELNNKGRRYRCGYCLYNSESEFETVKSQKDITLSSFGLDYVCDICGEIMDSYNRGTIIKHIQKHEDDNKVSEAEYYFNPYSGQGGHYNRNTDTVNINLSNRGGELFNELYDNLAHEYGHKVTTEDTYTPYEREFAAFMVETGGDWERSKILTFLQPRTHVEIISKMPSENGWVSDDTLNEYFATLDIESNQDTLKYAEHLVKHPEYPEYSKQFIAHFLDYANKSFASETTDSKIRQWLKVLRDTDPDWEEIDWEKPSDKPDPDWGIEWEAETSTKMRKCDVCSMPARHDEDLCSNCWAEYLSATYANNNWKEHQHQEAIAILNWMCKPADKPKEPMACPRCNSDELEHSYDDLPDDETIITSSGTITANTNKNEIRRHYSCGSCSAVWVESWIYDSLLIVKRGTNS